METHQNAHQAGARRPLDENALAHTINMMPWRTDELGLKLREFAEQLWTQFCSVPAAAPAPAVPASIRNLLLELLNEPDRTLQDRPDRYRRVREAYEFARDNPEVTLTDMVPRAALQEVERERDYYKVRTQTMHEHLNGEVWYWQGDGQDHPESWVNSLPVVIRADQLRELMTKSAMPKGWLIERTSEERVRVQSPSGEAWSFAHVVDPGSADPFVYQMLEALLAAQSQEPDDGCDYCKHAFYAGLTCPNCGTTDAAIEKLGDQCIDGGKCHHKCTERCFRRQCCGPLSGYTGEWTYSSPAPSQEPAEANLWRDAVLERLESWHIYVPAIHDNSPRLAIKALITIETQTALDPSVCVEAAALVAQAWSRLPERETKEMHDAVMAVLYNGVGRTETNKLWQAYRSSLLTAPAVLHGKRYTVEQHGSGFAIYDGRDENHHGLNLARITETTAEVAALIEQGLNAISASPGKVEALDVVGESSPQPAAPTQKSRPLQRSLDCLAAWLRNPANAEGCEALAMSFAGWCKDVEQAISLLSAAPAVPGWCPGCPPGNCQGCGTCAVAPQSPHPQTNCNTGNCSSVECVVGPDQAPLTNEEITTGINSSILAACPPEEAFAIGVRFAERAHREKARQSCKKGAGPSGGK